MRQGARERLSESFEVPEKAIRMDRMSGETHERWIEQTKSDDDDEYEDDDANDVDDDDDDEDDDEW